MTLVSLIPSPVTYTLTAFGHNELTLLSGRLWSCHVTKVTELGVRALNRALSIPSVGAVLGQDSSQQSGPERSETASTLLLTASQRAGQVPGLGRIQVDTVPKSLVNRDRE